MRAAISITSATLFVALAGFNVWAMLSSRSARNAKHWIALHRVAGYAFIAVFAIFSYFMLLRVKGLPEELSPRIVLHMALAVSLLPLLLVKVMVARYQKGSRDLLCTLGIGIFVISFTLVMLNLAIHFLRAATTDQVPGVMSATVVFILLVLSGLAFAREGKGYEHRAHTGGLFPPGSGRRDPDNSDRSVVLTLGRVDSQTHDAKTLRFLLPPHRQLSARPGQFLTFEWFIDGKVVTRSYSICSSPTQTGYVEITPKRVDNGSVSHFLNDHARPGLTAKARGPYGQFYFDESKHTRIVMIAGGSGITPMMAILRHIEDRCIPVHSTLIYCVRSGSDIIFGSELSALQQRLANFRYTPVLSQPGTDWKGRKGRLCREILEGAIEKPLDSTYFLCGPSGFMEVGRALLEEMSVEPSRILQESFGGAVANTKNVVPKPGHLRLTFARSKVTLSVSPERTLLESAEANGVLIPSGCRQGSCSTCSTRLLNGNVSLNAHAEGLNDELRRQGYILPCVSRPLSDITLDA